MTSLILGVLLWSLMHFAPAVDLSVRRNLISKVGENPYKGIFALLMFLSIYLIITGWKATVPEALYVPPEWGRHVTALFMLGAFILFFAPYPPNNFKRVLRHPQLTGLVLWSVGHLFSNGEIRSIILFGGLALWAIIDIVLINRRDGVRSKPEPVSVKYDIGLVIGGLVVYVAVMFSHQWLFGVSPMG